MPSQVRLWRVDSDDRLEEISRSPLDLEARLEAWLDRDISVLDPRLLVIGRQVETDFGGYIDLLCLDPTGDVVIVELKRDKTPREVVAQLIDYASWVQGLSHEKISQIAEVYLTLQQQELTGAFRSRFGGELPDVLNENHSLLLVGSFVDASSERIIAYLSDIHGVRVNAATFDYFGAPEWGEFVARTFLLEPGVVEHRSVQKGGSKRRSYLSLDEFKQISIDNGVQAVYDLLVDGLRAKLHPQPMKTMVSFYGRLDTNRAIINLMPPAAGADRGLPYQIYLSRLARFLGCSTAEVEEHVPTDRQPWSYGSSEDADWSGYSGSFRSVDEAARFVTFVQTQSRP